MQESSKSRRSRVSAGFLAFVSPLIAAVIAFSLIACAKFGTSPLGVSSHTRLCDSGFRAGRRLDYMDFVLSHIRCSDSYI